MIFSQVDNEITEGSYFLVCHGQRVGLLADFMVKAMGWGDDVASSMYIAGRWHDLGKSKIPLELISKSGKLSSKEILLMQMHPIFSGLLVQSKQLPDNIINAVIQHHENFNGTGYPLGLVGEQISVEARILRICDTFDALKEERSYRHAKTDSEAIEIMREENRKGTYDKKLFEVFLDTYKEADSHVQRNCSASSFVVDGFSGRIPVLRNNGQYRRKVNSDSRKI